MWSASVMEDFTPEEMRETIGFTAKPDQSLGKCAVVKHFVSLGIPTRRKKCWQNFGQVRVWRKVRKEASKWKKSCQAPCFCQEEASSTIMWPCRGACEEAGIKVRSDQEFAWTGWSHSLMKYMENTKFCSCQTLQVLIRHFQLEPCSTTSSCRMCMPQEAKPSMAICPQTPTSGGYFGNPKRVGLRGMLRSPNWAPAQAQHEQVPSRHGLRARPSMHEPTQDRHPWSSRGLTLRPFGISFLKSTCIKVFRTICIASQLYKQILHKHSTFSSFFNGHPLL